MVRISFPINTKCSCCPNLVATNKDDDVILKCDLKGKCPVNIERNWAKFGYDMPSTSTSPFIKKL